MTVNDEVLGECELEIYVDSFSSVDSFIEKGYSITLDRDLTDEEINDFELKYAGEVQEYSWENGSRNHN